LSDGSEDHREEHLRYLKVGRYLKFGVLLRSQMALLLAKYKTERVDVVSHSELPRFASLEDQGRVLLFFVGLLFVRFFGQTEDLIFVLHYHGLKQEDLDREADQVPPKLNAVCLMSDDCCNDTADWNQHK